MVGWPLVPTLQMCNPTIVQFQGLAGNWNPLVTDWQELGPYDKEGFLPRGPYPPKQSWEGICG